MATRLRTVLVCSGETVGLTLGIRKKVGLFGASQGLVPASTAASGLLVMPPGAT